VSTMLRFAQSPTGDMHIDDLRVAILSYLVSQQRNESFIIRIDDTDKASVIEGKDTEIMQILEKFALKHASVFHQSEHLHMHQTLAIKLLEEGKAFVCTCKDEQEPYSGRCENVDKSEHSKLKESGTPFVIRIKKRDEVDAFVILRADSTPTEVFASACDDMLSGITMVIDKEEEVKNASKVEHIKTQLGYSEKTNYIHVPMMSDAPSLKVLFEEGYLPDAIINYLLLLTSPDAPQEIFTLPEAIGWFNTDDIPKSTVKFDMEKLRYVNGEHLRRMDDKQLSTLFGFADADIGKLAKLYLEEVSTITELKNKIEPIFAPKDFQGQWANEMRTMETLIQDAPMFHEFHAFEAYLLKETGLTGQKFFKALRLLLTGAEHGPELSDIYPLIKPYILEIAS